MLILLDIYVYIYIIMLNYIVTYNVTGNLVRYVESDCYVHVNLVKYVQSYCYLHPLYMLILLNIYVQSFCYTLLVLTLLSLFNIIAAYNIYVNLIGSC